MKRIAVTGANGYIGAKLVMALLPQNDILAITRHKYDIKIRKMGAGRIVYCNLEKDALEDSLSDFRPEIIISTTCCYETDPLNLYKTIDANYIFPSEVLRCTYRIAEKDKTSIRFISLGSSLPAYLNLYSLTKSQFVEVGNFFSTLGNINFCNVLLESFYGGDEPENRFISRVIRKLKIGEDIDLTTGLQQRDYISIEDVISSIEYLALTEKILPAAVPLGSGISPSIREIIQYLALETHSQSKLNFGAIPSRKQEPSTWANLSILRSLGFKNEFTYWKEGMKRMIGEIE
jgi:nucleoside-diphosphate-sugar epimerase